MIKLDSTQERSVLAYCRIAATSGALLSLKDLADLLAIGASETELAEAILSNEFLSSRVIVESGHVLMAQPETERAMLRKATEEADRRKRRAIANVEVARTFAPLLGNDAVFIAVAGTTSYLSASEGDDIDYYVITKTDGMWVFLLKSFLLTRISSLFFRSRPPFCFSFVMDERQAREELSEPKGALYARDTLTAKVITGGAAYHQILENASWMRSYYPTVYERRLGETADGAPQRREREGSRVLNLLLYRTLGGFVLLKAWALNRQLTKAGRSTAIFRTEIGPGRLEYVSRRYLEIGKMYQTLEKSHRPQ
jgi:hypothetical protein